MKPALRRTQILDAALRAFTEGGYHGTHISDIVAEAGVARGTFYRHFKSKHEVFLALIDDFFQALEGALRSVGTASESSPLAQVHDNLERFVRVLFARPALTRLMLDQGISLDVPVRERMHAFSSDLTLMMERSLATGERLGVIRPVDKPLVARVLVGAIKEIFYDMLYDGVSFDVERVTAGLIDFAAHGIQAEPAT